MSFDPVSTARSLFCKGSWAKKGRETSCLRVDSYGDERDVELVNAMREISGALDPRRRAQDYMEITYSDERIIFSIETSHLNTVKAYVGRLLQ